MFENLLFENLSCTEDNLCYTTSVMRFLMITTLCDETFPGESNQRSHITDFTSSTRLIKSYTRTDKS